jgi:transposase InsO family protein
MSGRAGRRHGEAVNPTTSATTSDDDDDNLPDAPTQATSTSHGDPLIANATTATRGGKIRTSSIPKYNGKKSEYTFWATIVAKYMVTVYGAYIIRHGDWAGAIDPLLDAEILFILLTSTTGRAQKLITNSLTARDAWNTLKRDFAQGHAEKLQESMLKLSTVQWIPGKSIATAVEKLADKIASIGQEIESYGGQQSQIEQIRFHILKILPREFDTVRQQIIHQSTIADITDILMSHAVLEDSRAPHVKPAYYTNDSKSNSKRPGQKGTTFQGICFACRKPGHRKSDCKQLQTALITNAKAPPKPCKFCKGKHWHSQCPRRQGNTSSRARGTTNTDPSTAAVANFVTNNYDAIVEHGRSQERNPSTTNNTSTMATLLGAAALLSSCGISDGLQAILPRPGAIIDIPIPSMAHHGKHDCLITKYAMMSNDTDSGYGTTHHGFVCDNGCSWSLVTDPALLENYRPSPNLPGFVTGPGTSYSVDGHGTLRLILNTTTGQQEISIPNVRYCPQFKINLLSDEQLVQALDLKLTHTDKGRQLHFPNGTSSHLLRQPSGLFTLDCTVATPTHYGFATTQQSVPTPEKPPSMFPDTYTMQQLHRTFGHRNYHDIQRLAEQNGWKIDPTEARKFCDICTKSKRRIAKTPSTKSTSPLNGPGIIVSTDYIGPFETGVGDVTGAYIFVDNFSRHPMSYTVKHKSEMLRCFKQYLLDSGLRINDTIQGPQILQSDTSTDVFSHECKKFCIDHGIRQRCSAPYTQAQNGLAERHIRTIKSMVRTLLLDANLPHKFWPYALTHSCLLLSLLPNAKTNTSPFELQYGTAPNLNLAKMAPFGERCIIPDHSTSNKSDFTHSPNIQGYYLGYSRRSKSMFVWICNSKRVRESNNVSFPFLSTDDMPLGGNWHLPSQEYDPTLDDDDDTTNNISADDRFKFTDFIIDNDTPQPQAADAMDFHTAESIDQYHSYTPTNSPATSNPPTTPFVSWRTKPDDSPTPSATEPEDHTSSFLTTCASLLTASTHAHEPFDPVAPDHQMNMSLSTVVKYEDHRQCKKDPLWTDRYEPAHNKEMESMMTRNVFTRLKRSEVPKGANIVKSKMIYALKLAADGSIDKYKARLVAKGYSQLWGIDYFESYAPTPMHYIFRILITLALIFGMIIRQFDISTAFLHGELNEDIYMAFPPGMEETDADGNPLVVKLNYGLYGLKQGARSWNATFHKTLTKLGFTRSQYEPCLYMKGTTWIYVYVDDLIVFAPTNAEIDDLYSSLTKEYKVTGGEPIKSFLGMHMSRSTDGTTMTLSQKALIEQLADKFPEIKASRKVSTPMPSDAQFYKADCTPTDSPAYDEARHNAYRRILGTLLYICGKTRPELSYSLSKASTVMSAPCKKHYDLLWHIFRYVYHTRNLVMKMKPDPNPDVQLQGYTDSDWARDISTRKSTTGNATTLNNVIISSTSKSQTGVAHSSAEAELVAATVTCKDIVHQRRVLSELGFPQTKPTILHCDSQSAMDITNNPIVGSRLRHVQISDFWCRELVDRNIVQLQKIAGTNNLADIFTKPLAGQPFYQYRAVLGIIE